MMRPVINSSTFSELFKNDIEFLAMMAASLTKKDINIFRDNITCDSSNPDNVDYLIEMPNDYEVKLTNLKTNEVIIINF